MPPYIVDFECRRSKLIIEVDGGQHGLDKGVSRDTVRDRWLQAAGYRVLRFWNNQVDQEMEGVMEAILHALSEESHPTRPAP